MTTFFNPGENSSENKLTRSIKYRGAEFLFTPIENAKIMGIGRYFGYSLNFMECFILELSHDPENKPTEEDQPIYQAIKPYQSFTHTFIWSTLDATEELWYEACQDVPTFIALRML